MDFGTTLKELRKRNKMTQLQLANLLGITKSVVSFYENRERTPSPEILVKIASVFHVTTDYLLGIDRSKCIDVSGLSDDDVQVIIAMINALHNKSK